MKPVEARRPALRAEKRRRAVLLTVIYLSVLAILTTSFALSQYIAKADGSSSSAIASFKAHYSEGAQSVSVSLEGMMPGDTRVIPLTVTNESDVSISYTLTASSLQNLPLVFTFDTPTGELPLNADTVTCNLTVTWPAADRDAAFADEIDAVCITMHYEQLD